MYPVLLWGVRITIMILIVPLFGVNTFEKLINSIFEHVFFFNLSYRLFISFITPLTKFLLFVSIQSANDNHFVRQFLFWPKTNHYFKKVMILYINDF